MGRREGLGHNPWKLALRATRIKTPGNVPANLPEVSQISQAKPLHWLGFKFFLNHSYPHNLKQQNLKLPTKEKGKDWSEGIILSGYYMHDMILLHNNI